MTAIQKLDAVLNHFYLAQKELTRNDLIKEFPAFANQIDGILIMFNIDEHFIYFVNHNVDYRISAKGMIFKERGGYAGQIKDKNYQNGLNLHFQTQQSDSSTYLNKITSWIAVGTVIAALYYLLAILKLFSVGCFRNLP